MKITTIGIDLAKAVYQIRMDERGKVSECFDGHTRPSAIGT